MGETSQDGRANVVQLIASRRTAAVVRLAAGQSIHRWWPYNATDLST
jgi:hypothetical protein